MTPQEKEALLMFMGNVYGQAAKADREIVNPALHLRPISVDIQEKFKTILNTPTSNTSANNSVSVIADEGIDLHQVDYVPTPVDPAPIFSSKRPAQPVIGDETKSILENLHTINLTLNRIATILESKHVRPKKTRTKE